MTPLSSLQTDDVRERHVDFGRQGALVPAEGNQFGWRVLVQELMLEGRLYSKAYKVSCRVAC